MKLIGISGKKKSGKDEVLKILRKYLPKKDIVRLAFADALKEEICTFMGISIDYLDDHKDNFRLILQGWGTDYRRKLWGEDYWLNKMANKIHPFVNMENAIVVIPDVRFENECQFVKDMNGTLLRIIRAPEEIDSHPSEISLDTFDKFDFIIENNGSLESLEEEVKFIIHQYKLS